MSKECCNANSGAKCEIVDYKRLDRVPEDLYKKMLDLHRKYVTIRKTIDDQKGLISPIRALVFQDCCSWCDRNNFVQRVVDTIIHIQFRIASNKFEEDRPSVDNEDTVFMNKSKIVGYCVALPDPNSPDVPYTVGVSYCRPADFDHFNREFGIVQAYNHALEWNSCTDVNPEGPNKKMISTDRRRNTYYIWPNSFNKQVEDFYNRADKYFRFIPEEK